MSLNVTRSTSASSEEEEEMLLGQRRSTSLVPAYPADEGDVNEEEHAEVDAINSQASTQPLDSADPAPSGGPAATSPVAGVIPASQEVPQSQDVDEGRNVRSNRITGPVVPADPAPSVGPGAESTRRTRAVIKTWPNVVTDTGDEYETIAVQMSADAEVITFRVPKQRIFGANNVTSSSHLHGKGVLAPDGEGKVVRGQCIGLYGGRFVIGYEEFDTTPAADAPYLRQLEIGGSSSSGKLLNLIVTKLRKENLIYFEDEEVWICARDSRNGYGESKDDGDDDVVTDAMCAEELKPLVQLSLLNTEDECTCINILGIEIVMDASVRTHGELTTSYGPNAHKALGLDWEKHKKHLEVSGAENLRLAIMEIWEHTTLFDSWFDEFYEHCAKATAKGGIRYNWLAHHDVKALVGPDFVSQTPPDVLTLKLVAILAQTGAEWMTKVVNGSTRGKFNDTLWKAREQRSDGYMERREQELNHIDVISDVDQTQCILADVLGPIIYGTLQYVNQIALQVYTTVR
jgi:hypothetical protein